MEDLISRRKAIDALMDALNDVGVLDAEDINTVFQMLPSAQTEHIKGRWILAKEQRREDTENGNYMYNCSNCDCGDLHSKAVKVSYCWNCGADMKGEQDGCDS